MVSKNTKHNTEKKKNINMSGEGRRKERGKGREPKRVPGAEQRATKKEQKPLTFHRGRSDRQRAVLSSSTVFLAVAKLPREVS